ncbi:hypothetical protein, partial [Pectobacterium aroidearum]|uniref:hypothetical protein n=1 Tax=Pectobacterium aroidearum TaxID=1201031 RepID=UPI001C5F13FA
MLRFFSSAYRSTPVLAGFSQTKVVLEEVLSGESGTDLPTDFATSTAENPPLGPAFSQNCLPFTSVHSHAGAQKSSGAFFRVVGRERCRKRPSCRRIALRTSQGVRPRDVMVNAAGSIDIKNLPQSAIRKSINRRSENGIVKWSMSHF